MTKNFSKVKNDVWETPDNIYHHATDIFGVYPRLDVCATEQNRKCEFYFVAVTVNSKISARRYNNLTHCYADI